MLMYFSCFVAGDERGRILKPKRDNLATVLEQFSLNKISTIITQEVPAEEE